MPKLSDEELREKREAADAMMRSGGLSAGPRSIEDTIAQIKKDLMKQSPLPEGTVLRWVSVDKRTWIDNRETVNFAVFLKGKWEIVGSDGNTLSHTGLMERLVTTARSHIVSLEIASEWKPIELF
jgi:hypothetical protein